MIVFDRLDDWRACRKAIAVGRSVGFVPTMGALHAGHGSLISRARLECDVVVLSIFVNPTQFNDASDLAGYPVTLDEDLALAERLGCDFVILPSGEQVYPDGYRYKVSEAPFSAELCGAHRPGHFDGVLTVVLKLLNLVRADRAYFGEKDFQQLQLVSDMVAAFFLDTEIVACPTVREPDGLALSSRNRRLSSDARQLAPVFAAALRGDEPAELVRARLEREGFEVDYVQDRDQRRLGAVVLDGVRLIDNVSR